MTLSEYIHRVVDQAPPLTAAQKDPGLLLAVLVVAILCAMGAAAGWLLYRACLPLREMGDSTDAATTTRPYDSDNDHNGETP